MTTRLQAFRAHCERMAEAEHKPECPMLAAVEPYWPPGGWVAADGEDERNGLTWIGPPPAWEPPHCDGCNPQADRDLFARLAAEVAAYEDGALFEVAT